MNQEKRGISSRGLKNWGLLFMGMWIVSRVLTRILLGSSAGDALALKLESASWMMPAAGLILILEALSVCAVPVYTALLLEGIAHTADLKKYFLRTGLLALACEIPWNILSGGRVLDFRIQNPLLGILICMLMAWFLNRYADSGLGNLLVRILVMTAAAAWCILMKVEYGLPLVLCTAVLWIFRKDRSKWGLAGMMGSALSILLSPFFLAAPMGAILVNFYNGERGEGGRAVYYILFLLLLTSGALAAAFL